MNWETMFNIMLIALVLGGMVAFATGNMWLGGVLYAFPAGNSAGLAAVRLMEWRKSNGRV